MRRATVLLAVMLATGAEAGKYNQVLSPGDAAPAWADLPETAGGLHSLVDVAAERFVLLVFTCNSCPASRDYEDRLIEFSRLHAGDLSVVAVNVNTIPEDDFERMKERAAEKKFPYPYLFDASQAIAKDYGASGTPEFFLLSPSRDGTRTVLYMGAMDDNSELADVQSRYLADALAAARQGKPPEVTETFAPGCRIRFEKERRRPG